MDSALEQALRAVARSRTLRGVTVHRRGEELHLSRDGESFARLAPAGEADRWRIEVFRNRKKWEVLDFAGPLAACLDLLADQPYDIYWES